MIQSRPADWQLLITTLPSRHGTPRMRVWRALKAVGAAVLRDGVYLLPFSAAGEQVLLAQAREVRASGGTAYLFRFGADDASAERELRALFERSAEYGALLQAIRAARAQAPAEWQRLVKQLRRDHDAITAIDYFPGAAQAQTDAALADLERDSVARLTPGEPRAATGRIARQRRSDYQRRSWATRRHLWVDRAASAWLIKRHIDPKARFVWLDDPRHCPAKALGFDFDGATFTHVGARVTFEVLLASFGLETDAALLRLGTLVHYLDVGGVPMPEAAGLETILKGARAAHPDDDDALLNAATPAFDCLYAGFTGTGTTTS